MLGFLSKFVLQMLPTISATVIGAYIVATWINPKTPPDTAKIAAQSRQAAKASGLSISEPQIASAPVVERSAEAREVTKPVKAANGPDYVRIIPIVKERAPASETPVDAAAAVPSPEAAEAADERKDANELARAAIQRLRGGRETARPSDWPSRPPALSVRVQQARSMPEAPQTLPETTIASAPPLPPAMSISAPRYPQDQADDHASALQDRLAPPREIPAPGYPLRLQASHRLTGNPSLADDFLSATRSFLRAIAPH